MKVYVLMENGEGGERPVSVHLTALAAAEAQQAKEAPWLDRLRRSWPAVWRVFDVQMDAPGMDAVLALSEAGTPGPWVTLPNEFAGEAGLFRHERDGDTARFTQFGGTETTADAALIVAAVNLIRGDAA